MEIPNKMNRKIFNVIRENLKKKLIKNLKKTP